MPRSWYPDVLEEVKSVIPLQWSSDYRVLSTEFETGPEVRQLIDQFPRRAVKVVYRNTPFEDMQVIRKYYDYQAKGPSLAFDFIFPQIEAYEKELVGVVTRDLAAGFNVTLPCKEGQNLHLFRNNSSFSSFQQSVHPDPGPADTARINSSLSAGDYITASFSGRMAILARFSNEPLVMNDIKDMYCHAIVELYGLVREIPQTGKVT